MTEFLFRCLLLQLFQPVQSLLGHINDDTWNTASEHFCPTSVVQKTFVLWWLSNSFIRWSNVTWELFVSMCCSGKFLHDQVLTAGFSVIFFLLHLNWLKGVNIFVSYCPRVPLQHFSSPKGCQSYTSARAWSYSEYLKIRSRGGKNERQIHIKM